MYKTNIKANVVLIVVDGFRMDLISRQYTPYLEGLIKRSTTFSEARSVFPSMTRVATSSIATGCLPNKHGIIGNAGLYADVLDKRILDLGTIHDIGLLSSKRGAVFPVATFSDRVARAGKTLAIVSTAAAGTVKLLNPNANENGQWVYSTASDEASAGRPREHIHAKYGHPPAPKAPKCDEVEYATKVFLGEMFGSSPPDVRILWLNEPDTTFHYYGLGTPEAQEVLAAIDNAVGQILDAVAASNQAEDTHIIIASDHGHATVTKEIDVRARLREHGIQIGVSREALGDVDFAMTSWSMGALTDISGRVPVHVLTEVLQEIDGVGNIFASGTDSNGVPIEGTLPLSLTGLNYRYAPDVAFSMFSDSATKVNGVYGACGITAGTDVAVGGGMHGGLGLTEMRSTLVVCGSSFSAGATISCPVSICDISPTVCELLGVPIGDQDGIPLPRTNSRHWETMAYTASRGSYQQTLHVASSAGRSIVLEGTAKAVEKNRAPRNVDLQQLAVQVTT